MNRCRSLLAGATRSTRSFFRAVRHGLLWIFFGWTFTITDILVLYAGNHLLPRTMEWWIKLPLVVLALAIADKYGVTALAKIRFNKLAQKYAEKVDARSGKK